MTEKFVIGFENCPLIDTGAVVREVAASENKFPFGEIVNSWPFKWTFNMDEDDVVFGLGESVRGINKRGFTYESWCSDVPGQNEGTKSMYGAHNFLIVYGKKHVFGLFFDTASRISFDIGFTEHNILEVSTEDTGVEIYVIRDSESSGKNQLNNIVKEFRALIGTSYIPPMWAFGFQQSRWGYKTNEDVQTVVDSYRKAGIGLDSVCLDIDYMTDYKDFTVDEKKFPEFKNFTKKLSEEGIHLIPIIDAGVKLQEGYDVCDDGVKNNFFCKKADGKDFVAGVWPGRSYFPDFLNPDAREWFGSYYRRLLENGVEGFWNDMNEPAMFYSDESLEEAFEKIRNFEGENLDVQSFFEFKDVGQKISNSDEDYKRFYHNASVKTSDGSKKTFCIRHDKVHNIFGGNMTRASAEGMEKILPNKRTLLYSRASCIGAHRYGGIWTGDNCSQWAHLEQEIKMLPSLNMCGFLYSGADIGGFGQSPSVDLVLRWTAFGVFTPLMRNHSAWDSRVQECYSFGDTKGFKSIVDLRYALLPYIYSEFVKAAMKNEMYFKPLCFDFSDDERALDCDDEILLGNEILLAPIYKQNARGRYVYLPEDMTMITWENSTARAEEISAGDHYINVPLNSVVFFIRKNKAVPFAKPASCVKDINSADLKLIGGGSEYELYEDDGFTRDIKLDGRIRLIRK